MIEDLLHQLSLDTWHFLRDAPFHVREETITETILVNLTRHGAGSVWIQKQTTAEEAETGMDWAMAIRDQGTWMTYYIQAKNLFGIQIGRYQELRNPKAREQAENLIWEANIDGALPLYAFYNKEIPPFRSGVSTEMGGCRRALSLTRSAGPAWMNGCSPMGITVAHAEVVLERSIETPAKQRHASYINQFAVPWECLYCPEDGYSYPLPSPQTIWASRRLRVSLDLEREDPPEWAALVRDEVAVSTVDADLPSATYLVVVDGDELPAPEPTG